MPTPVGHAIGGLAAVLLTHAGSRRPYLLSPGLLLGGAVVAILPDLDILIGSHRTYTHSVGAIVIFGLVSWGILRRGSSNAGIGTAAMMAAYASHLFLDWLGKDTSRPPGLMMLWPFSSTYFLSGFDIFGEVSRRYWRLDEFIFGNLRALGWEMLVLMPVLIAGWMVWSNGTVGESKK